jgi:hypothetical protein
MSELSAVQRRQVARWRKLIVHSWQKQVHAVVATGRLLIRAHDDLIDVHGAWSGMVRNDLPFGHATAKKLMAIAKHPVLRSGSHENRLPVYWTTLYELSKVEPAALTILIDRGVVNPRTRRDEAEQMVGLDPASAATFEPFSIIDYNDLEDAARSLRWGLAKFIDAVNHRLGSDEPMTEGELELVASTIRDAIRDLNGIGMGMADRVRPMRTINEQLMLESSDEQ